MDEDLTYATLEEPGNCLECQQPFLREVYAATDSRGKRRFTGVSTHTCPECVRNRERREKQALMEKRWREWRQEVGAGYAETHLDHPDISEEALEAARSWVGRMRMGQVESLGLIGPARIGKTRCMAAVALEQAALSGKTIMLLPAHQLRDLSSMSDEVRAEIQERLVQAERVGVLLIDDIGKEAGGSREVPPACASGMFRIIDARIGKGKATLWTANGTAEQVTARYPEEYRERLRRRLEECRTVNLFTQRLR